jgi:putative membrane protein
VRVRRRVSLLIAACIAAGATPAAAHTGQPLEPHDLAAAWTLDPPMLLFLAGIAWLYARGVGRLWRASHPGRGVNRARAACFATGWVVLAFALLSPLHAMGSVLFSAHMVQHELLMAVAAPLLVLGRPLVSFVWGLPPRARPAAGAVRRVMHPAVRALRRPVVAWSVHAVAILAWHLPAPYQATLANEGAHFMQHASFLGSAVIFWWAMLDGRRDSGPGAAVIALFTTMMYTGVLGALLTFSPTVWYPWYASTTGPWGLSPLEDQQLGGLIMWIPGGASYIVAAMAVLSRALRAERLVPRAAAIGLLAAACLGAMSACREPGDEHEMSRALTGGDARRGEEQIRRFGCGACHVIPGVAGARGLVGPPLTGVANRVYIAGVLTNTPDNLVRWIMTPQGVDSLTAMPNLGVGERDARDIAAYLYTLR